MQRHQFEAYLDKVFDWRRLTSVMTEGRQDPRYPWSEAFDAVFLGSACQFGPLHRIETECRHGALHQRIGTLSEDMLGYAMQRQNPAEIFDLGCQVAQQLKRNGVLHSDWARGRVVAAVDGIEICSSYCRCCDACMSREVERKVAGKLQKSTQYYHRLSAVTVVSTSFPIFLGIRFQQAGETEVACSLALLKDLSAKLGRRFIDILVADAIYLQTAFVREVEALSFDWVINLKENQPDLLAEAGRLTAAAPQYHETTPQQDLQSLDDRRAGLSDHHHGLSPEATLRPSRLRPRRVDPDPCRGLHLDDGLLLPSGPQPLPRPHQVLAIWRGNLPTAFSAPIAVDLRRQAPGSSSSPPRSDGLGPHARTRGPPFLPSTNKLDDPARQGFSCPKCPKKASGKMRSIAFHAKVAISQRLGPPRRTTLRNR